jgi:hypothetical protein
MPRRHHRDGRVRRRRNRAPEQNRRQRGLQRRHVPHRPQRRPADRWFDPQTCVGTITQTGPFRVYDGTGRFAGLGGSGTYWFHATYTTGRNVAGCTKTVTAYIETINGAITVST